MGEGLPAREATLGTGSLTALMGADPPQTDDTTAPPRECSACRGTGRVISNLGGTPQEVPCPWCDGTGRFIPGHDAQARHRGET
jgi:DnaJ-class molecular chaperone